MIPILGHKSVEFLNKNEIYDLGFSSFQMYESAQRIIIFFKKKKKIIGLLIVYFWLVPQ